jgi:hypothetical protein
LDTPIINVNNLMQNVGPSSPRHELYLSGMLGVPGSVQVSFISSFNSRQPCQPIFTRSDFYGTGVEQFLLPCFGANQFNFGLGESDLDQTDGGRKGTNPAQVFPLPRCRRTSKPAPSTRSICA